MRVFPWRPRSLTARVVTLVVLLVAAVGMLVAGATAYAMSNYLRGQLDSSLDTNYQRQGDVAGQFIQQPCPLMTPSSGARGYGQANGTLTVRSGCAFVVIGDNVRALTDTQLAQLAALKKSSHPQSVQLTGLGHYRVIVNDGIAAGVPLQDVDAAVRNLVIWELALTLTGVVFAGLVGSDMVHRQLRPLREVAETAHTVTGQQLAEGRPTLDTRVPIHLTDTTSEAGRVGAALNTLLDHVDEALTARHHSEQRVRRFVADASHELRTPLATIQGYAELTRRTQSQRAQETVSSEEYSAVVNALDKVETEAERMAALVEDLLLLARLDSGRPLESSVVDLTRLTLEAVADARVVAPNHHWRLDLTDEPISVIGDEVRLHQVITNLLNNARKHTPPGTTITVGSHVVRDGSAEVTVHDDGPGLPQELVPHVFERFSRGDTSRNRSSGGAGLGLSLVSAITTALGGRVSVDSKPGSTTFTVRLPQRPTQGETLVNG